MNKKDLCLHGAATLTGVDKQETSEMNIYRMGDGAKCCDLKPSRAGYQGQKRGKEIGLLV